MSFIFTYRSRFSVTPKSRFSYSSLYDLPDDSFGLHDHHYTLVFGNPEPDYDELLFRLSSYAFDRLSPRDQQEQVEELRVELVIEWKQGFEEMSPEDQLKCMEVVHRRRLFKLDDVLDIVVEQGPDEIDEAFRRRAFAKLFKKHCYSNQLKLFLSKVIAKFKRERQLEEFISSFKQLDADQQRQLIEESKVHLAPKNHEETEEDCRLRRFTQLCRKHTEYVYKFLTSISNGEDDQQEESSSDWKSCFAEFFFGFSKLWFEGQSKRSQDLLIEQLSHELKGVTVDERPADESEEDFKLRKFTKLCKEVAGQKVADFQVQDRFLQFAEVKLRDWEPRSSERLVGERQDRDSAAKEDITDDQEDIGVMETLTKLFDQVGVSTGSDIFRKTRETLLTQKCCSEAVRFFMGSCCEDQNEIMDALACQRSRPSKPVIQKFREESEEDFRLRKFKKLYMEGDYDAYDWGNEAINEKYDEFLTSNDNEEYSPYVEFLFDVSTAWFKTRCASYWINPIHLILFDHFGNVDNRDVNVIEKLPEESEEEFRLRRFMESFKGLNFNSQENIVNYIQDTLSTDFGTKLHTKPEKPKAKPKEAEKPPPPPCPPPSEWIVMDEIQQIKDTDQKKT